MTKNESLYHAFRMAYNAGSNGTPWHMFLHALREGLNCKDATHVLTDNERTPTIREFLNHLKASNTCTGA